MQREQKPITIADLFPNLSPEERAEVEETFRGYIQVCWRIFKRLENEGKLDEVLKEMQEARENASSQPPVLPSA